MKKTITSILFLISFSLFCQKPVFTSGKEGYKNFRIPAIIRTSKHRLLAFCEGRKDGGADFGDIDIVLKISENKGKTWSPLKIIVDNGMLQAGNPAPVIDMTDPNFPKGRIFLFYNTGNKSEKEIREGLGIREIWYISSTDMGENWSSPVNITQYVHKPKKSEINLNYKFSEDWRSYANTPGHAVQLLIGPYKGRILVAANHSEGNPQADFGDYFSHAFYSDNHGKTFHLSNSLKISGSNEATAAQTNSGTVILNARNQKGDKKMRITAISDDGGSSWNKEYFEPQLNDPICEGSLLFMPKDNILLLSNLDSKTKRDSLTLSVSLDQGKTWSKKFLIDYDQTKKYTSFCGYSDIVELGKEKVGLLYERQDYNFIVFKRIKL